MSDHQQANGSTEEHLLSRVVDRLATPADWATLTAQAESDPALWQRLGETLKDECMLQAALRAERADAQLPPPFAETAQDQVPDIGKQHVPINPRATRGVRARPTRSRTFAMETVRSLGFAALGAVLCLLWFHQPQADPGHTEESVTTEAESAAPASSRMFARYLEQRSTEGGLIEQLPDLTLTSQATEDGRVEVVFLRRIVERAIVRDAWTMAIDEHGNPDPVRVPAIEAVAAANF